MTYLSDTFALAGRLIKHNLRSVDTIITVVLMPIMMLLLMVYLFGSAMKIEGFSHADYVNYVLPGILLMTIATGSAYTALRIFTDKTSGMFDRFKSLLISKSAVMNGQAVASVIFLMISTLIVPAVGFLVGFRSDATLGEWALVILLLFGAALAITWITAPFALMMSSIDGASAFSYIILLFLFISSAFVPAAGMPKLIRGFAENQPMTHIIQAVRSLMNSQPIGDHGWIAAAWIIGITIVFAFLSSWMAKRV
ncbi:ABC transporter permease protein [Secundilactobacillus oryzae JCM 18671]|uniref:Transport permease protein n=1 Tax=Secundilactobacillus oryzae JCM 18671 TaxID=1291743 RepID=A0A081BIH9_9LACO|nr:ABC transporter permease [Secundilactobacillus oryzae]GAK47847.1 ABC transporter permease protein [Secundilactobacillus oryzae JCM 18671]